MAAVAHLRGIWVHAAGGLRATGNDSAPHHGAAYLCLGQGRHRPRQKERRSAAASDGRFGDGSQGGAGSRGARGAGLVNYLPRAQARRATARDAMPPKNIRNASGSAPLLSMPAAAKPAHPPNINMNPQNTKKMEKIVHMTFIGAPPRSCRQDSTRITVTWRVRNIAER